MLQIKHSIALTWMSGLVTCLLGSTVLIGWLNSLPVLVRIYPGWVPMVVSTALCFVFSGLALLLKLFIRNARALKILLTALGGMVLVISGLHALEMLFNVQFAIDLAALHAPLQPEFAHPGRMAPPTALGFIMYGISLLLYGWFQHQRYLPLLRFLTGAILMVGLFGLITYWLKIEFLYNWAGVVRMAFHTALGMIVLSAGLWSLWIDEFQRITGEEAEEYAINRTAVMVLIVVAMVSGLSGFAILQDRVEQVARENLHQLASDRRQFFNQLIHHRLERAGVIIEASELRHLLDEAGPDRIEFIALPAVQAIAKTLLTHGFSGVTIERNGEKQLLAGEMLKDPLFSLALHTPYSAQLIWNDGYYLRTRMRLNDGLNTPDYLILDQQLAVFSSISREKISLGKTAELVICQARGDKLACFPMQSQSEPFMVPKTIAGVPLPMTLAMSGQSGIRIARDFRGARVIAAYGPIGSLGLGMVLKIELAEVYAPIKEQFQIMLPLIGMLVLLGVGWMRRSIQPLVSAVMESKKNLINDLAERKKIEKMKNEFISTVSHELRTPLTSIRGSLGLLEGGAVGEMPVRAHSLLRIANKNCERLVRLINDILDIEKIESGNMRFNFIAQPLQLLIEQAIAATQSYADQYCTNFVLKADAQEIYINADSDRLTQVIVNLLSNAAKFSYPNHPVIIQISQFPQRVRVSVINQGKGIEKEFHNRIFQKFMQADSSDTRQKGGTGLGLNISKAIVEKHEGKIDFKSELDGATEFYFDLPLASRPTAQVPEKTIQVIGKNGQVLVCEDHPDIAKLLVLMLAQEGFTSDIASDATQARRMVMDKKYDAMTLDLGLPDEDGLSLLEWLRQEDKTRDLPVVIVSAKEEHTSSQARSLLGIKDWISKPIDENRLIKTLRCALRLNNHGMGTSSILHIEDDFDLARVIETLLSPKCRVTHAPTLSKAREYLEAEYFDAIMLDLELPDGNGSELLNNLPGPNEHTPVLILSGKEVNGTLFKSAFATLVKSRASNEQLKATLYHLLDISHDQPPQDTP